MAPPKKLHDPDAAGLDSHRACQGTAAQWPGWPETGPIANFSRSCTAVRRRPRAGAFKKRSLRKLRLTDHDQPRLPPFWALLLGGSTPPEWQTSILSGRTPTCQPLFLANLRTPFRSPGWRATPQKRGYRSIEGSGGHQGAGSGRPACTAFLQGEVGRGAREPLQAGR